MNDKRMKNALENIARRGVPENTNLWPNISARLERKSLMMTLRTRPVLLLLIILLALTLLTGVVYAIGKSLGYIPGVGFVEQNAPVRVLAERVSIQRDGITLTMKQAVADSAQTLVMYRVKGVSILRGAAEQQCTEAPALLLENGVRLESTDGYLTNMSGENGVLNFDANFTFPSLPVGVTKVTLIAPCQLPTLTLQLVPAPEGLVLPATEIASTFESSRPLLPTPTLVAGLETPASAVYPTDFPATPTPVPNGSGLYLEKVVELENSYLLVGNFTDAGDLPGLLWGGAAEESIPYEFHVTDRNGKPVSFSFRPDLMPPSGWSNVTYWALEVRKPLDAPVTITLPEIAITIDDTFQFPVDVGANPAVGQTWPLNQTVQVGGYSFLVEGITRTERGYRIKLRSPLSREYAFYDLQLEEYIAKEGYENFYDRKGYFEMQETLVFKDGLPSGALTFTMHIYVETQAGPWTLTWSPPAKP